MSFRENKAVYLANIHQFLRGEIDVTTFGRVHCPLWKQDRDEDWALKKNAPQNQEIHALHLLHQAGALTEEEYREQAGAKHRERSDQYLGYSQDDRDFCRLVDDTFVAIDAYTDPGYDLSESQLRDAIARYLKAYETRVAERHRV